MEAFLRSVLPRLIGDGVTFDIHVFSGKANLLDNLARRLTGYSNYLPPDHRIIVLVDRDDDDCRSLKRRLEDAASAVGLRSRTVSGGAAWRLVNRIAIEELEAWYFGDWEAVRMAYPRVKPTIPAVARYRDADAIAGGTWESLEKVLQRAGYFRGGFRKIEAAKQIGTHMDPDRNRSRSFQVFRDALREAVA